MCFPGCLVHVEDVAVLGSWHCHISKRLSLQNPGMVRVGRDLKSSPSSPSSPLPFDSSKRRAKAGRESLELMSWE